MSDDNAPPKVRGRAFVGSGNPAGRPPGSRNRATLAAEQLLDGEAETLTRKAIELAQEGNQMALKICMDRILPVRRDRLLQLDLPPLKSVEDAPDVIAAILAGLSAGELGIADAMELARLVELYVRAKQGSVRHEEIAGRVFDAEKVRKENAKTDQMLAEYEEMWKRIETNRQIAGSRHKKEN